MSLGGCPLLPSSSLPPLGTLNNLTEEQVLSVLQNLFAIYCPMPRSFALAFTSAKEKIPNVASTPVVDSGYVSGTEGDEDEHDGTEQNIAALRADSFERGFAERWLAGFIGRAEELSCLSSEGIRRRAIDKAACVLESFYAGEDDEGHEDGEHTGFAREFSFELSHLSTPGKDESPIKVRLNDGLSGTNSTDYDDVGLESWGASILLSELMTAQPARFGLAQASLGSSPRIIELGAGTGLISVVLSTLLPRVGVTTPTVVATDYHPVVLANLQANIAANFLPDGSVVPIKTSLLDWSAPVLEPPVDLPADMLIAADVVYAPEHAAWLRDCATRLLAPGGVFWIFIAVRQNGRFEGITETVEAAFTSKQRPKGKDGRALSILSEERLEKHSSIGRGDESGYRLFRIGWA